MKPKILKNETEYQNALILIDTLMSEPLEGPESDDIELWIHLVEKYELTNYPVSAPDPIEAIRFRMDQQGLKQKDLIPYIGSKSKVSEVMNGKRPLSLMMIRQLHAGLSISADVLIEESKKTLISHSDGITWKKF